MVEFPANQAASLWEIFPSLTPTPFPFFHAIGAKLVQTPWVAISICSLPLPLANILGLPGAKWALGNPRDATSSQKMISGLQVCVLTVLPKQVSVSALTPFSSPFISASLTLSSFIHPLPFSFPLFCSSTPGYVYLRIPLLRTMVKMWDKCALVPIKIVQLVSLYYTPGTVISASL